ncbi:cation diffusion facilitator family transporter [Natrononativus amylolyticus]|uniref:cation diffusion facilitator family transporter n=1 Tax=Natrononativus amylolyticus TaxID=2963434 RepID=UPI0020CD4117|nr:cation diffusion facilitator family transporter [Natrononativus amylolyticus]
MADSERLTVILVAMAANVGLAVAKFGAFLLTGSPSMLAETYHSISDTGNQVLLLIGTFYTRKQSDRRHPFGYGKASFFYAFLVSVLLFGIAGWESLSHGIDVLRAGGSLAGGSVTVRGLTLPAIYLAYFVLVLTLVFDGISYWRARVALEAETEVRGWRNFKEAFEKTSDTPVLAVLTENAVAVAGAAIALVAISLSQLTGDPRFDALGAVLIGLLLMGFAVALGIENKRLLLGESLPARHQDRLEELVREHDGVVEIEELRTVYFGPDSVLVTADIAFDPGLDTATIDDRITEIEAALKTREPLIEKVYIEPELERT